MAQDNFELDMQDDDLFSELFSVSEEEAFIIDDPELEKEVKEFFWYYGKAIFF